MFCLNDKQTKLREELRAFVEDNLSPQAVELEDSGAFPRELFRRPVSYTHLTLPTIA